MFFSHSAPSLLSSAIVYLAVGSAPTIIIRLKTMLCGKSSATPILTNDSKNKIMICKSLNSYFSPNEKWRSVKELGVGKKTCLDRLNLSEVKMGRGLAVCEKLFLKIVKQF